MTRATLSQINRPLKERPAGDYHFTSKLESSSRWL